MAKLGRADNTVTDHGKARIVDIFLVYVFNILYTYCEICYTIGPCLFVIQIRWLICEWLSWLLCMSRPGDESRVGSQSHRRQNEILRQLAVKSGPPSRSLISNVCETTAASTTNGGPASARWPVSTAPIPPATTPSSAILCRCPGDVEVAGVVEEEDQAPVRRGNLQCCSGVEALRPELAAILAEVRCVTSKLRSDEKNDEETSDWKFAAMVIDRLSFWTLTLYLVIVTIAVFGSVLRRS